MPEPPEDLEEKLCRPIKKLKGLVQGAALTEQVLKGQHTYLKLLN